MSRILCALHLAKVTQDEEGQALVEYGLLVALIAVVSIGGVTLLGTQIAAAFASITSKL
jgi:pilus assembly protein Flp/PilA